MSSPPSVVISIFSVFHHIVLGNKMVSHAEWMKACAPPIDVRSAGNGGGTTGPPKSPDFLLVEI
jgi:hypothetical protein